MPSYSQISQNYFCKFINENVANMKNCARKSLKSFFKKVLKSQFSEENDLSFQTHIIEHYRTI